MDYLRRHIVEVDASEKGHILMMDAKAAFQSHFVLFP